MRSTRAHEHQVPRLNLRSTGVHLLATDRAVVVERPHWLIRFIMPNALLEYHTFFVEVDVSPGWYCSTWDGRLQRVSSSVEEALSRACQSQYGTTTSAVTRG